MMLLLLWGCPRVSKETSPDDSEPDSPVSTAETGDVEVATGDTAQPEDTATEPLAPETHAVADVATAQAMGENVGTYFGYSLAVWGETLFVGQPSFEYGTYDPTAVHALSLPTLEVLGSWQGEPSEYDWTGGAIGVADIDADGVVEVAIGRATDNDGDHEGAVHLVRDLPTGNVPLISTGELVFHGATNTYAGNDLTFTVMGKTQLPPELWISGPGSYYQEVDGHIWAIDPTLTGELRPSDALWDVRGAPGFGARLAAADLDLDGQPDLIAEGPEGVDWFQAPWVGDIDETDRTGLWYSDVPADLGNTIEVVGDIDGDGADDLALAAPHYPEPEDRTGRAWLIPGGAAPTGTVSIETFATRFDGESYGEGMGWAVTSGDLDADGQHDLVIGAAAGYSPDIVAGKVMIFLGPLQPAIRTAGDATLLVTGQVERDAFGRALAITDSDADGHDDLLIAATGAPAGASNGIVYLVTAASLGL